MPNEHFKPHCQSYLSIGGVSTVAEESGNLMQGPRSPRMITRIPIEQYEGVGSRVSKRGCFSTFHLGFLEGDYMVELNPPTVRTVGVCDHQSLPGTFQKHGATSTKCGSTQEAGPFWLQTLAPYNSLACSYSHPYSRRSESAVNYSASWWEDGRFSDYKQSRCVAVLRSIFRGVGTHFFRSTN